MLLCCRRTHVSLRTMLEVSRPSKFNHLSDWAKTILKSRDAWLVDINCCGARCGQGLPAPEKSTRAVSKSSATCAFSIGTA